jgi:ParB-like chromosome segregation protein Spo0J
MVPTGDMRLVVIPLRGLPDPGKNLGEFGHRFAEKYQEENLQDLVESIKTQGLKDPPHIVKLKDDSPGIINGHRRVASLYINVRRNVPGFSLDMPVPCLEVRDASHRDLVISSILGNELSRKLDPEERLLAVKKADDAGATKKEIAITLGNSDKSVERDLRIVRCPRVLRHVLDHDLPPTAAAALIQVAAAQKRLDEFLDYFDAWAQLMREQIAEEDRRAKQERGKGLRPNQMLVMNRLESGLVRGWFEALAKGKPLTEEQDLGFEATFDKKTAVATVKVRVDALNAPVGHLARVASQVSQVAKRLAAFAKKRHELEGPQGPQAALQQDETFLDLDLLKEIGLLEVADQLRRELRQGEETAADTAPEEEQPPTEGQ